MLERFELKIAQSIAYTILYSHTTFQQMPDFSIQL